MNPAPFGSAPRKTFCATVRCGTIDGSCAIAATPCSSASRGERNETSSPSSSIRPPSGASAPATIRPSVDLPAPFSPTSACTEPAATASVDARERLDAAEVLGDVQELEVGGRARLRHRRPVYPGHSALNFEAFALVTTPPFGRFASTSIPPQPLPGLDGLDHALHAELALGRGPLHRPCRTRRPEDDGLEADAAAAVADQRHLLAVQRLLRAGRALVGADDHVQVGLRLEHRLRRLERVRRVVERLALGDDLDAVPGGRLVEALPDRGVERRHLHRVEVADLARVRLQRSAGLADELALLLADVGLDEHGVAGEPVDAAARPCSGSCRGSGRC